MRERVVDTVLQAGAHRRAVRLGPFYRPIEERPTVRIGPGHGGATQETPQDSKRLRVFERRLDLALDELPGISSDGVDDAQARPEQAKAPAAILANAETHRV